MDNLNLTETNIELNDSINNLSFEEIDSIDVQEILETSDIENQEIEEATNENLEAPAQDDICTQNNVEECTALVVTKPNSLFVAQKMFKKSIKISIKSFLISISLGFLNLFI